MLHRTFASDLPVSADELYAWHTRPGAFVRLIPPWAPVRLEQFEGVCDGCRAVIRLGVGPLALRWVAEHHGVVPGKQFRDVQVSGPFSYWQHTHRMEATGEGTSRLVDAVEYEPPGGALGGLVGTRLIGRQLRRQFAYRHRTIRQDLALHDRLDPDRTPLTVAVTGASGLVGTALTALLTTGGHRVLRLVRRAPQHDDEVYWRPSAGEIDAAALEGVDAVVHLAGENVFALRWTDDKKRRIRESRVAGTRLLAETLAGLDRKPRVFLSASAIGYYGDRGTDVVTESDPPARGRFLADVCVDWEAAAAPAADAGIRTVHPRIGVVLTPQGGALQLMLPAFWMGLGGRVGPKDLYLSWILLDDLVGGLAHLLYADDVAGPVNMTAPELATMDAFTRTMGRVLSRPTVAHVPAAVLRTAMGEVADETVLMSARVRPTRLLESGYAFRYADLEAGLRHVLGRTLDGVTFARGDD